VSIIAQTKAGFNQSGVQFRSLPLPNPYYFGSIVVFFFFFFLASVCPVASCANATATVDPRKVSASISVMNLFILLYP
jgi:hypothetical protein